MHFIHNVKSIAWQPYTSGYTIRATAEGYRLELNLFSVPADGADAGIAEALECALGAPSMNARCGDVSLSLHGVTKVRFARVDERWKLGVDYDGGRASFIFFLAKEN